MTQVPNFATIEFADTPVPIAAETPELFKTPDAIPVKPDYCES
jgi:hypothetical protein